ncbi:DNA-3-methyladenine glycosylase [Angustibacter sp. Root456]|uniref:DNA-3-methyladenine glycosylase n=1 Tax=Angustibacter sp. Root456 TaxID=1736539 RepID=UPI0009EA9C96|nr:DNA-3-methyladenine glycosylase [Angustibacter sp. Root456]
MADLDLPPGAGAPPRSLARLLSGPVLDVAPRLLGAVLEHRTDAGVVAVRLTEVEAYAGPGDPGSHARNGRTPRTQVMFGPPGHLYVYFSYGMHWCVNVVCAPEGAASAVLLRAGEVVGGHDLARARRPAARTDRDLARGPARLASALGLDGSLDGVALGGARSASPVRLVVPATPGSAVRTGPRVGVSGAGGDGERYPWRFWLDGEPSVSAYRPGVVRGDGRQEPVRRSAG